MPMYRAEICSIGKRAREIPREFGGTEQVWDYEWRTIKISAESDEEALKKAHSVARKRKYILVEVTKRVYRRRRKLK